MSDEQDKQHHDDEKWLEAVRSAAEADANAGPVPPRLIRQALLERELASLPYSASQLHEEKLKLMRRIEASKPAISATEPVRLWFARVLERIGPLYLSAALTACIVLVTTISLQNQSTPHDFSPQIVLAELPLSYREDDLSSVQRGSSASEQLRIDQMLTLTIDTDDPLPTELIGYLYKAGIPYIVVNEATGNIIRFLLLQKHQQPINNLLESYGKSFDTNGLVELHLQSSG